MSPDRVRVALLHDFDEASLFGMRTYAERLTAALAGRVELVHIRPPEPRGARLRSTLRWGIKTLVYPLRAGSVRADVFHVLDQSHADLLDGLCGRPTVVTCHDLFALTQGSKARRALQARRLAKLKRASRVIAVSQATADLARERLGLDPARLAVVRNPLDRFFLGEPTEAENLALDRAGLPVGPFALHVGANLAYKNIEGAVRALGEVARRRGASLALVKVGTRLTSAQRRIGVEEKVPIVELGELSAGEIRALYRRAALLLYPSWEEGWGWPVVEAMAGGLPVVVSRARALLEVTAGAALEAEADDVAGLAAAIVRVLEDEGLARELAASGRARARELVGEGFADDMIRVYEEARRCVS